MITTTALVLLSVFVLIYTCTLYTLGQSELRDAKFVLAFPVSILCVLGLLRGGGDTQKEFTLDLVLIPYATLAYAFIFMIILLILFFARSRIQKMLEKWNDRRYEAKTSKQDKLKRKVKKAKGKFTSE